MVDCYVKLDKMSHCCSFDVSLSKKTRGNYIVVLLLGITSSHHINILAPCCTISKSECFRLQEDRQGAEIMFCRYFLYNLKWMLQGWNCCCSRLIRQRELVTLSFHSELLRPLPENEDKSVWHITKEKKERKKEIEAEVVNDG